MIEEWNLSKKSLVLLTVIAPGFYFLFEKKFPHVDYTEKVDPEIADVMLKVLDSSLILEPKSAFVAVASLLLVITAVILMDYFSIAKFKSRFRL